MHIGQLHTLQTILCAYVSMALYIRQASIDAANAGSLSLAVNAIACSSVKRLCAKSIRPQVGSSRSTGEENRALALRLTEECCTTTQGYHVPAPVYDWFTVFLEALSFRAMMVGEAVKVSKLCRLEYWAEYKKWKKKPLNISFFIKLPLHNPSQNN